MKWRIVCEMPLGAASSKKTFFPSASPRLRWKWQEFPDQTGCGLAMNVATRSFWTAISFTPALKRNAASAAASGSA